MKSIHSFSPRKFLAILLLSEMVLCFSTLYASETVEPTDSLGFVLYKGIVVDRQHDTPLAFASIMIRGTNISTITNTEGVFFAKSTWKCSRRLYFGFFHGV